MNYEMNKRQRQVLSIIEKISPKKFSEMTEQELNEANNRDIPNNRIFKKLLGKPSKHIEETSYVIPVDDGVITGYLYEKEHSRADSLKPLIVYFHGGGWIGGNMGISAILCSHLADVCSASVLSIDYRMAPKHKFPIPVEDCYRALEWARGGARYWKIDPDRIFLLGDSAGGNLCASVSRLARDRKGPHIAGQVLIYPATDGRMSTPSYTEHSNAPILTSKDMKFFINSYAREQKDILDPIFSPLLAKDHSRLPETLIITAENDPLKDDGVFYAQALESADTKVKLLQTKNSFHAFLNYPLANGFDESICAIRQYIGGRKLMNVELMSQKAYKQEQKKISKNHDIVEAS